MVKLVHTVIIKYCTDVIWHRLHGAHCSHQMLMCNANIFLGCDTHTQSHRLSVSQSHGLRKEDE